MSEFEHEILLYLRENVSNGHNYFKSKYIAKDTGLSARRVGAILFKLSQNPKIKDIEIKQYSTSLSTTWRVMRV
jgi:hypothetical protein